MNNKKTTAIVVAAIVVLGAGAVAFMNNDNNNMSEMSDKAMTSNASDSMKSDKPSTMMEQTNKITYKGFAVIQKSIKVKKGTTVTWTNEDNAKHDVTPVTETEEFKASELFGKGETHSVTFNTVGKFAYLCSPHPYMKGTIEVTE